VKVLELSSIAPSVTDQNGENQGGIVPINLEEGDCLKLTVSASGSNEVWLICFNSLKQQQVWLKKLKDSSDTSLTVPFKNPVDAKAFVRGEFGNLDAPRYVQKDFQAVGPDGQPIQTSLSSDVKNTIDGYWVTVQSWSSCTLSCGGGTQTTQRQCVPPKATGKPCIGNAILVQPCNTQPCDTAISLEQQYVKVNPLAVQTRQFSLRPMREERCIVKEGDLDLVRDDL